MYIVNVEGDNPFPASSRLDLLLKMKEYNGGYLVGPLESFDSGTLRGQWRNDIGQLLDIVAEKAEYKA